MMSSIRLMLALVGAATWNLVPLVPAIAIPSQAAIGVELAQQTAPTVQTLLKNATYSIPDLGEYTLSNGQYQANDTTVTLVQPIAVGDIDGDGDQDAAVILAVNTGGSGLFMYLAAVTINNDQVSNPNTVALGDRVRVQSLKIKDGRIRLNVLTHQPDDPQCCPSELVSMAYQFNPQDGTLMPLELSDQERQAIHMDDLPSQMLPGDDNVPFQPQDDQFQIQL